MARLVGPINGALFGKLMSPYTVIDYMLNLFSFVVVFPFIIFYYIFFFFLERGTQLIV